MPDQFVPEEITLSRAARSFIAATSTESGEMLAEIERRYPGFRFRIIDEQDGIREHIKIFVNGKPVDSICAPLQAGDTVHIMCALSGGV